MKQLNVPVVHTFLQKISFYLLNLSSISVSSTTKWMLDRTYVKLLQSNMLWSLPPQFPMVLSIFFSPFCIALKNVIRASLTHFMPLISFYTSWKHENTSFFYVFRGYRKKSVAWNGLKAFIAILRHSKHKKKNWTPNFFKLEMF